MSAGRGDCVRAERPLEKVRKRRDEGKSELLVVAERVGLVHAENLDGEVEDGHDEPDDANPNSQEVDENHGVDNGGDDPQREENNCQGQRLRPVKLAVPRLLLQQQHQEPADKVEEVGQERQEARKKPKTNKQTNKQTNQTKFSLSTVLRTG